MQVCGRCGLGHTNRGNTDGCIQALREIISALTLRVEALEEREVEVIEGEIRTRTYGPGGLGNHRVEEKRPIWDGYTKLLKPDGKDSV